VPAAARAVARARARVPVASRVLACVAGAAVSGAALAATPFDPGAPLVVEGDILISANGLRGVGTVAAERRWSYGEVPYIVDAALPDANVRAIAEAVAQWNAVSGVTLTRIEPDAPVPFDHLVFLSGPGCASWVGRQGGPQEVWIGPSCDRGSVLHEIGHALGLEHEHTRSDRDAHVRIVWENILPEKRHNFAIAPDDTRVFGGYDVRSIMHYGPANFSIDGAPTIVPREPVAESAMGQRDTPSTGDLAAVARLYASDLALAVGFDDEHRAHEVTLFVTNYHSQGAHGVSVTLDAPGARVVGGDDGWRCQPREARFECRLDRLPGHADTRLVLALDTPRDAATLRASLDSKTPDLNPTNNGGFAVAGAAPALAAAMFADQAAYPAAVPDDAAGTPDAEPALGGAGVPSLLGLFALALGRRRRGAARYWAGG